MFASARGFSILGMIFGSLPFARVIPRSAWRGSRNGGWRARAGATQEPRRSGVGPTGERERPQRERPQREQPRREQPAGREVEQVLHVARALHEAEGDVVDLVGVA